MHGDIEKIELQCASRVELIGRCPERLGQVHRILLQILESADWRPGREPMEELLDIRTIRPSENGIEASDRVVLTCHVDMRVDADPVWNELSRIAMAWIEWQLLAYVS